MVFAAGTAFVFGRGALDATVLIAEFGFPNREGLASSSSSSSLFGSAAAGLGENAMAGAVLGGSAASVGAYAEFTPRFHLAVPGALVGVGASFGLFEVRARLATVNGIGVNGTGTDSLVVVAAGGVAEGPGAPSGYDAVAGAGERIGALALAGKASIQLCVIDGAVTVGVALKALADCVVVTQDGAVLVLVANAASSAAGSCAAVVVGAIVETAGAPVGPIGQDAVNRANLGVAWLDLFGDGAV